MHLAIARDYFSAYARLPRKAQAKADEFLRKLLGTPNDAGLHLELIRGSQDKHLRSVRIGDDHRLILRTPDKGNIVIILWIDQADEAQRWAISKLVEVHPATGNLQLFDPDAATRAVTSSSAAEASTPRIFAAFSDEDLIRGGLPRTLIPTIRTIASENELDWVTPHLPTEAAEILTGLAAGFSLETLLEEILEPGLSNASVDTTDIAAALARTGSQQQFRMVGADFDLEMALAYPLDVWRVFLHPKQRVLARARTKGPMRVTGGAGTGKTVVALHRVAFLVREVYVKPDDRLLFTTFTVNLALDLKRQLEKLLEPHELARIDVRNIDALAFDILRKKGEDVRLAKDEMQDQAWQRVWDVYGVPGFNKDFCATEWREVIQAQNLRDEDAYVRAVRTSRGVPLGRRERRQLWPAFEAYRQEIQMNGFLEQIDILRRAREQVEKEGGAGRYRTIVVDETQDFSLEALRLVRALAGQEHPDDLFLVGDAHQRIYGRPVALGNAGIHVRGRRSQQLRLNYRTTAAICRWSLGALGREQVDDLDEGVANRQGYVSLREGRPPQLRAFEHAADEVQFVIAEVKRLIATGIPPEGICITARTGSLLRDRFLDALVQEGIAADIIDRDEPRHPSVRLATMHRIKGLEFPVVFVVSVNSGEIPFPKSGIFSDDPVIAHRAEVAERCLLYVAASRARDVLHVTSFGEPSPFLVGMGPPPPALESALPTNATREDPSATEETTNLDNDEAQSSNKSPQKISQNGETLLTALNLPTRLYSWAEKKGITTLEGLMQIHPRDLLSERNLGRKTISDTRKVIEALLGHPWEEAFNTPTVEVEAVEAIDGLASNDWNIVREHLPAELAMTNLAEIDLPARIQTYTKKEGLVTLADLAKISKAQLLEAKNLGRASIPALIEALRAHVERVESVRRNVETGFLESWKGLLQDQDPVRRMVFTRRAGLAGVSETLKSIGETLGMSRERVRQLENAVVADLKQQRGWLTAIRGRIETALANDAIPIEQLGADPWWKSIAGLPTALDYFGETLLDDEVRVIEVEEQPYLARCTPTIFEASWDRLRMEAGKLPLPSPLAAYNALVEKLVPQLGRFLAGVLFERLREQLHIEESTGIARVVGIGTLKSTAIIGMLRASPTPVRIEDIIGRVGRFNIPEEIIYFDAGLIGLEQHFPDFRAWMERLVPRSIDIMQTEPPERQWLANEILEDLHESMELPEWMSAWHLAALLRKSGRVRYLGRNRFGLLESPDERGRIHYHEELTRILREHGEPMSRDDLIAKLSKKTTARPATVAMFLARPPFIAYDADRIGLGDRDLPGGAEAMAEALEHVAQVLERRNRGLGAAQVKMELSRLSQVHASWSLEMCMSVLRGDPRFRFSQSGGVGLSQWETVGVPTRADIVKECLEKSGGRVTVEAVQLRIEAYYGSAPERLAIGQLANRFGAVLRGDWLEQSDLMARGS